MKRTTYAGDINEKYLNKEVVLKGWVQRSRNLGGLIFIDLRDRAGLVQVVFNEKANPNVFSIAEKVKSEDVVEIKGLVKARNSKAINSHINSGKVEVEGESIEVLSKSKTPPFEITDNTTATPELRMKYRYLDLRRPVMQKSIMLRSKIMQATHQYFNQHGFVNIETPDLTISTPEGARDYVVPSRVYPGSFYALPQSPQQFKQLLMGAGFDRYYQIVKCFRDEDLRGDRQPEFTQIDVETSFLSPKDIQSFTEGLIKYIMKESLGVNITTPFPRITWQEAMNRFGSDQPDTRFGMELKDLSSLVKNHKFKPFNNALAEEGQVKAIAVPQGADKYSRKKIDKLAEYAKSFGANNLFWLKVGDDSFKGPLAKFFASSQDFKDLTKVMEAKPGDLILFVADRPKVVADTLGHLRTKIAEEQNLIPKDKFNYLWVVDWPLFSYDEGDKRWVSAHHPFTMPNEEDIHYLSKGEDPHKAHAQSYDIILNGLELGGGSIRIHTRDLQEKMFRALGFTKERMESQFGYFLKALDYGFPPHGGIALGLDRFVRLLANRNNIRDVIAFPKNSKAIEPLTGAPAPISRNQLDELGLDVDSKLMNKDNKG